MSIKNYIIDNFVYIFNYVLSSILIIIILNVIVFNTIEIGLYSAIAIFLDGIMIDDYKVSFCNREFECVDKGFEKNESIDVVIRPEDIKIVKAEEGMLKGTVKSVIFKGVHYEMVVAENDRTWIVHNTKFSDINTTVGLDIYPEDIHIMKKVR